MEKTAVQQLCDKYEAEFRKWDNIARLREAQGKSIRLVDRANGKALAYKYSWYDAQRMVETERQQIIEALFEGTECIDLRMTEAEQYYNDKYGK